MANKKITELTQTTDVDDNDLMLIETVDGTCSIPYSKVKEPLVDDIQKVSDKISGINADLNQRLILPRTKEDVNLTPALNTFSVKEQARDSANLPEAHWFHVLTGTGDDADYNSQLAIGMTSSNIYHRTRQQSEWKPWDRILKNSDLSDIIPMIFNYATAEQPLFAISTSSEDTIYYYDRGCKRNSSEKAMIFKCSTYNGTWHGYAIIAKTREGVSCTALTQYGDLMEPIYVTTPKGYGAYISIMKYQLGSASGDVKTIVNGSTYNIKKVTMQFTNTAQPIDPTFMLAMADYYIL